MNSFPALPGKLESLAGVRVLCVGDVMLDHFVYGEVSRISPEAPVPVIQVQKQESMLGGAGNVVRNLCALGARVSLASATGEDVEASELKTFFDQLPECTTVMVREHGRRTSVKRRYVAHGQQLLRADCETIRPISSTSFNEIVAFVRRIVSSCDVVVLSDYGKGVLSGDNARALIELASEQGKPVVVDPKGHEYTRYQGATVIKPNLKELAEATGMPVDTEANTASAARHLLQLTNAGAIVVTLGAGGMMLVDADQRLMMFPSQSREVFDVSGAGDTVAATLALATGAGIPLDEAVFLSNIAAGLVVAKVGTAVVERDDLRREFQRIDYATSGRQLYDVQQAADRALSWRESGLQVGFLSGSFETIGATEIGILQAARVRCDRLVVAVTVDGGAYAHGGLRATQGERSRAVVLAAIGCIDLVVVHNEAASTALVCILRPHFVFKSTQHKVKHELDYACLDEWGGTVVSIHPNLEISNAPIAVHA